MKLRLVLMVLAFLIFGSSALYAAPERMMIKDKKTKAKQSASRAVLKNVDLEDIEDPAAKRAIGEILNYLNLPSKK